MHHIFKLLSSLFNLVFVRAFAMFDSAANASNHKHLEENVYIYIYIYIYICYPSLQQQ